MKLFKSLLHPYYFPSKNEGRKEEKKEGREGIIMITIIRRNFQFLMAGSLLRYWWRFYNYFQVKAEVGISKQRDMKEFEKCVCS